MKKLFLLIAITVIAIHAHYPASIPKTEADTIEYRTCTVLECKPEDDLNFTVYQDADGDLYWTKTAANRSKGSTVTVMFNNQGTADKTDDLIVIC